MLQSHLQSPARLGLTNPNSPSIPPNPNPNPKVPLSTTTTTSSTHNSIQPRLSMTSSSVLIPLLPPLSRAQCLLLQMSSLAAKLFEVSPNPSIWLTAFRGTLPTFSSSPPPSFTVPKLPLVSTTKEVWSLNDKLKAQLPSRLLVGGVVVPWAPQVEVLNHAATGAFLTHCGWNSVTESICGGVPMICRPMLGDQRLNARAASEKWKFGLMVEESDGVLTKEWLSKALLTVLKSVEGRTMRERVVRMKEMAHKAVEQGGSSAQSLDALLLRILGKKEFSGGLE